MLVIWIVPSDTNSEGVDRTSHRWQSMAANVSTAGHRWQCRSWLRHWSNQSTSQQRSWRTMGFWSTRTGGFGSSSSNWSTQTGKRQFFPAETWTSRFGSTRTGKLHRFGSIRTGKCHLVLAGSQTIRFGQQGQATFQMQPHQTANNNPMEECSVWGGTMAN